ncbi:MAG: glycosyltransferase family 2 protein [Paludibacter sp.]
MPVLSIITINYNNAVGLKKTIESVAQQVNTSFEYIVIDGGSTDGSQVVINQYANYIDIWISEPDSGIYNAMNKGIGLATGEYLLFINSGDWLATNRVVENVTFYLGAGFDILSGELELVKPDSDTQKLFPPPKVDLNYSIKHGLTHPNTIIKKSLFDKYGYYNEQNAIISDWEFFLVACGLNTCKYQAIPVHISCFAQDGISSQNTEKLHSETKAALKRLLPWWKKLELYMKRKYKRIVNRYTKD